MDNKPLILTAAAITLTFVLASAAVAQVPVQYSQNGERTLVQSDVGDERWAMTYTIDTGGVTGNVFIQGGDVAYVDCTLTAVNDGTGTFACSGADPCSEGACGPQAYTSIGNVELPISYFFPDETDPEDPPDNPPPDPNVFCNRDLCATDSGLRQQCEDSFNQCIANVDEFNQDECVAGAFLFCRSNV